MISSDCTTQTLKGNALRLPRRVTFIAGTLAQGGAERQLFYILQALRNHGVEARVLSLQQHEYWQQPIEKLGVPVTWVGQQRTKWQRLLKIRRELTRELPEVVQSQHFFTNLYSAVAARSLGLREIGAIRNDVCSEMRDGNRFLGQLNLKMPRILAANSRAGQKTAADLGVPDTRCLLLPNVVDTERFHPGPVHDSRTIRILGIGRLVPQKRFDRFLRILAAVRQQTGLPVRGQIAGTGPLKGQLMEQAAQLGLDSSTMEFLDVSPEPSGLYRQADIFLLTSDHEGTPNVVLEAIASGLPVASTAVGGAVEIITHEKDGLLAKPDDEEALISLVHRLVENPALRSTLGTAARAHAEAQYAVHRLPAMLSNLYQAVLR